MFAYIIALYKLFEKKRFFANGCIINFCLFSLTLLRRVNNQFVFICFYMLSYYECFSALTLTSQTLQYSVVLSAVNETLPKCFHIFIKYIFI